MTAIVDCPVCARKTEFSPANRWRPFCSERCKMIDLGQWASGSYVIPGDPPDPEQPSDAPAAPPRDRN
jgi:endogenous inhibitor of DNA gyrase (YacG/DUF329 family)